MTSCIAAWLKFDITQFYTSTYIHASYSVTHFTSNNIDFVFILTCAGSCPVKGTHVKGFIVVFHIFLESLNYRQARGQ